MTDDESTETYTIAQIREAFAKHSAPDEWGVRSHYEKTLISALRGEYDEPEPVMRTAQEWCDLLGAVVADRDGWRDGTRDWEDEITRDEFDTRLNRCTIDGRGYPNFLKLNTILPGS